MSNTEPSLQEIMQSQGTRLSDVPPWMTYASEFDQRLDPQLAAEVEEYSKRKHERTSNQAKEELHRQKEINDEVSKQYQFLHPSEYADEGPRVGKIMHSSELINTLRNKCKVNCWYRDHPQPKKLTLLVQPSFFATLPPSVGCWVQAGYMPEYSIVRFDQYGVPLDEKYRGWRTVLLQLIIKGIITEGTANTIFGKAYGPASSRYLSTLKSLRNEAYKE